MATRSKAIVLLSGGIDSSTCLHIAREEGYALYAMSFDYQQRHRIELEAAKSIANQVGVEEHQIVDITSPSLMKSALTGGDVLPKYHTDVCTGNGFPNTYVPARNTLFLAYALGWAESLGADDIFIGVNALDYNGYPDCRPEFIAAFESMANFATKASSLGSCLKIHSPLIKLSKADIIAHAVTLGVDFKCTHSCYDPLPDGRACGGCDACVLRLQGFADNNLTDPVQYYVSTK